MGTLLEIAEKEKFLIPLLETEKELLQCMDEDNEVNTGITELAGTVKLPCTTSEKNIVRAKLISWLCSRPAEYRQYMPHGIRIRGYRIKDKLELNSLNIPFYLSLRMCIFPEGINLRNASVEGIDLSGSFVAGIEADGLAVSKCLRLSDGFRSNRPVSLMGASIKGDLNCFGGHFGYHSNRTCRFVMTPSCDECRSRITDQYILNLEHARINGSLYLCGEFTARGGVNLADSTIGVNINCTKGKFYSKSSTENPENRVNGRRLSCNADFSHHLACAFNGDGLRVNGNLILNKIEAYGEMRLTGAQVDGDIESAGGKFVSYGFDAIYADRLRVLGNIFFSDGFNAEGIVRLPRAEIGSDLSLCKSILKFAKPDASVLFCNGIQVRGTVYLIDFEANGGVDVSNSTVGGNFNCTDSKFRNGEENALNMGGIEIKGSALLNGKFAAEGRVSLKGSNIGLDLICSDGHFKCTSSCALDGEGVTIGGNVDLNGNFTADGGISLDDASIGGFLNCEGGKFIESPCYECKDKERYAISAGKLQVSGSIYLSGFNVLGEVMLNDLSTGRNLVCKGGMIDNKDGITLRGTQMKVVGSVIMAADFKSIGEVRINDATIGGNLDCSSGLFIQNSDLPSTDSEEQRCALRADGAKIGGSALFQAGFHANGLVSMENARIGKSLFWKKIREPKKIVLDLRSAKAEILEDEPKSWPNEIMLNGFEYQFLGEPITSIELRLENWLKNKIFRPQPYEQLAAVLKHSGYESQSQQVLIKKNKEQANLSVSTICRLPHFVDSFLYRKPKLECHSNEEYQSQTLMKKLCMFILGIAVGYGYKPQYALYWGVIFVIIGMFLFDTGFDKGIMAPTKNVYQVDRSVAQTINYSKLYQGPGFDKGYLNAFFYSLDVFLPVVDFNIGDNWVPTSNPLKLTQPASPEWWGRGLYIYRCLHIILGWVITTLFLAALSGIVRR